MEISQTRLALLQNMPIFGGINASTLGNLLEAAAIVEVAVGQQICREKVPGTALYVLEKGQVEVFKTLDGQEITIGRLREGDCFGEMAMIDLAPRSASVRATTDCTAIEITQGNLYQLYQTDLEQFTMIYMNIARELSRRLRQTDQQLFEARMAISSGNIV